MNTITTNTQMSANISQAAAEIQELLEQTGFTSDNQVNNLHIQICDIIKKNIEGNTNYAKVQ